MELNNICPHCQQDTGISRPRALVYHADCALETSAPKDSLIKHSHLKELGVSDGVKRQQIIRQSFIAQINGEFDTVEGGLIWIGHKFGVNDHGQLCST